MAGSVVVVGHPDDELMCAGAIHSLSSQGTAVTIVAVTAGGGGAALCGLPPVPLRRRRLAELADSARVLGAGAVCYESAETLPYLHRGNYAAVAAEHVGRLIADLRRWATDSVITFGPDGVTGHPTHIIAGQVAHAAASTMALPVLQIRFTHIDCTQALSWLGPAAASKGRYLRDDLVCGCAFHCASVPSQGSVTFPGPGQVGRRAATVHRTQGGDCGYLDAFVLRTVEHYVLG